MKKIIVLLFLFLYVSGNAEIKGHIEYGKDLYSNVSYTEWELGYNFYFYNLIFRPYGNQITWFEFNNNTGDPFCGVYTIGVDLKYDKLTFDLQHFCSHSIGSTEEINRRYYDSPLAGQMTKLSARYSF